VKLSNKGRYAVRALFDIAFYNDGRPTQVKDIADRQDIPTRFLEQIFQELKRAGLVGSKRGPQGGYNLLKPSEEIRLGDILRLTEGSIVLTEAGQQIPGPSCRHALELTFEDLAAQIEACFDNVTLADMCARAQRLGVPKPGEQRYTYSI
jgi:Rrf2 family protein